MQTPSSSSLSSVESPRLRRSQAGPAGPPMSSSNDTPTSRRLTITLPKMTNFLTLASPKKLQQQQQQQQTQNTPDKNEPSRFLGDGVSFKAKLIGILEVGEARGDRMCQEALADLKMAIRAAGEHKQRITINIAIDGLRLRDEKTMDCLYHHPVHKISFIAQDMTDSRAFGYIFGSPDTGHRFFGIKTDKAAGQVVVAMRDLFQVVFELKKKEIELAKQHIEQQQSKFSAGKSLENLVYSKHGGASSGGEASGTSGSKSRSTREELRENGIGNSSKSAQQTSEVIADLVDLEIELNSIQQGIHQMEKITPSDPFGPDANTLKDTASSTFHDPFEDSFSPPPGASSRNHPALLPPPSSTKGRASKRHTASTLTLDSSTPISPPAVASVAPLANTETWFDTQSDPLFGDTTHLPVNLTSATTASAATATGAPTNKKQEQVDEGEASGGATGGQFDVFTELDPLGTGKIKPYVDKKDFFQELKNPPKKVLKELAGEHKENEPPPLFNATFESTSPSTRPTSSFAVSSPPAPSYLTASRSDILALDPFADTDPFGESDPFVEEELANAAASFPSDPNDPFDTCFADFTMFGSRDKQGNAASVYHGPLRVSLPAEKAAGAAAAAADSLLPPPPSSSRRSSPGPTSKLKSPRLTKQASAAAAASNLVRLPSPKMQSRNSRRLAKQTTLGDTGMRSTRSPPSPRNILDDGHLSSSSLELTDIAPEPPPRPDASKPPPLPPKRQQQSGLALKPPPRPPLSEQYDYINHHEDPDDSTSPPLPVPVRRPKSRSSDSSRPRQQSSSVESCQFSLPPPPAPAVIREEKRLKSTGAAANLTLRQLTKMNISELASSLNVSPGHLSKMTLQELASFLASVSTEGSPASTTESNKQDDTPVKRDQYSTLRESVDDEVFKADFENNFTDFPVNFENNKSEDVFQEAPFDKYAVFRELLEQEEGVEVVSEEVAEEIEVTEEVHESPVAERSDSAMAEEGRRVGEEEEEEEEEEEFCEEGGDGDKYAALREICSEPPPADEESDKEDSVTEAAAEKLEDDFNLLTLSRQQSESPESPTLEAAVNVREAQSIIESTILEEDANSEPEELEDMKPEDSPEKTIEEHTETADDTIRNITPESKSPLPERMAPPSELALPDTQEKEESWANFEETNFDSVESRSHHDEAVSPWSIDGRDFPATKAYKESPESAQPRSNSRRRHAPRRESPWQDDEDDEDWEGRNYRENGWRDSERRPRKKSPWGRGPPRRTSPWEDDDEEGDVEEYEEVAYTRPPPIRGSSSERRSRRPPSWDDEEADYDEPRAPRRAVGWGRREYEEKRERSGSRGEYIERRRWEREEEEKLRRPASSKYPGSYATWGERGNRKPSQERRNREAAAMRRKQYDSHYWHYRDQRPPPADYDYDDPEGYDSRYKKKGAWPKRPASASDVRKGPPRRGYQSPGSAHSHDPDHGDEERRFRTPSGGEPDFNSDQEPEYIAERAREQYEQRSHTLHSRRNQKQKRNTRLSSEDFFSPQQKSPFEDDFSTHSFHASEFSSMESPSAENAARKQQHESVRRKDSQLSEPELKLPSSSPMEEDTRGRDSKTSHGSSRRQSPFEDDFTPPDTRRGSARVASSMSSDVSEHRRSPHDDLVTPRSVVTTRGGSLAADDVFFPASSLDAPDIDPEPSDHKRLERRGWSEHRAESSSRQFAGMRNRLGVFRSTDSANINIKKSESVNIFARDSDPFDDDFFVEESAGVRQNKPSHDKPKNSNDSFSKWSEPFETFNFKEEDEQ